MHAQCQGTLLIIYYPQSPEDNGGNLETRVESGLLYVPQKPQPYYGVRKHGLFVW